MMPAPTWALDLRAVRATAHRLYCSCQEPSSPFKTLARSVRALRNRLEEADEALDETSVRPEDIAVLQAAGESRDVLNRLERALSTSRYGTYISNEQVEEEGIACLLHDIDEATRRLSDALEVLEYLDGNNDLPLNARCQGSNCTSTPRSPSTLTSSSDDGNKISSTPSLWSFDSRHASFTQRLSASSEAATGYDPEKDDQHVGKPVSSILISHQSPTENNGTPPVHSPSRWVMHDAFFDPMSVDIDSASSLITARQPDSEADEPVLKVSSAAVPLESLGENSDLPTSLGKTFHVARSRDTGNGGNIARSVSLRDNTLPTPRHATLASSASFRLDPEVQAPRLLIKGPQSGDMQRSRHSPSDEGGVTPEPHALDFRIPSASPTHHAPTPTGMGIPTTDPSRPVMLRRPSRQRMPSTSGSMPVAKSRYRIVNPSDPPMVRANSFSVPARPSARPPPIIQRHERRWHSEDQYSTFYPSTPLPSIANMIVHTHHELAADAEIDSEFADAIVAAWNASKWEQAGHNIELLLGHQTKRRGSPLIRRLHHLLGVIHSLRGQLSKALDQFLAAWPAPIEEAFQLDAGHCAAAYWMADIYALLGRRTEAVLAYSVAARNPLLQDARWLPIQQQMLVEREACRSGATKTGVNEVDWSDDQEHESDAQTSDSILDGKFMARDVARALLQSGLEPTNRRLDPNRSRAMAFHDLGLQSGSWQEKHALQLDTTALEPTGAWPLPHDPLFALENVRQHRLLVESETDLLQCGLSVAKIPKKSRVSFSCHDLRWLIQTSRACLKKLNMEWSEVVIENAPRFIARYTAAEASNGVAFVCYLSLPIYRLSFRPGYGVEICPDGVRSSRLQNLDPKSEKGVSQEEAKRVKKSIKEALEMAAKRHEALESSDTALPVMSINGVTSLHRK